MRKIILIVALMLGVASFAQSQKVIRKSIDTAGKVVDLNFDFADTILVEAWNKSTLELEVTVDIDENRYNEYYSLDVNEYGSELELKEKVDFDGIKKLTGEKNLCNFNSEINYKLKVPASLDYRLKTISGKIVLIGGEGEMTINTISGFIDYSIPVNHKAHIDLSTVTGDVYSNVKFDETHSDQITWVGTKRDLTLNGGTTPVELKTVSGDIFLRKLQ